MDTKGEISSNTVIVEDITTLLTSMDKSSRHKINKETMVLNDILGQMDLSDVFKAFNSKAAEYTFFSSAHGRISRIDHTLACKTSLIILRKLKLYQESSLIIMV